jgi:periplasmic protein TonB
VGAGVGGANADGLRQYRLALAREARRYKRYPERALLAGIGGTAEIRVEYSRGRVMPVERLARSSGNDSLDAAALEMMRLAAPRAAVPESLRGREFAVTVPVVFDIDAERD